MLIRVRSKDGNFRLQLEPTDDASTLLAKILETTENADSSSVTISQQPRGGEVSLSTLRGRSISSLGITHADLIFVAYAPTPTMNGSTPYTNATAYPTTSTESGAKRPWETVVEDHVDQYWRQRDGKIHRSRDPNFCRHAVNGMCDYCMPLEPYDATHQTKNSIKHLSFHAHLRQIAPQQSTPSANSNGGATPSTSLPPLSPLSYRVKTPCPSGSHAPYPAGICTACQPSAITLSRQTFRSTDHLEIASPGIIEGFLESWRLTGRQRFGWLLGAYKPYEEVPMGVKAVVEAIHEPPQDGDLDGLSLQLPWDDEKRILELAGFAGLQIVGMIFTDLTPDPDDKSKSLCKRHKDSFFLSSLETMFAAREQLRHPLHTRSSPTGIYSSRLVTAVLSGLPEGGVDLACYMASEQGCAMVDADMIEPTVEPGIVKIKGENEGEGRYVPDVFYTYKNEYGIQVKSSAKPCFPVEYLLVNVTHGFPTNPSPLFRNLAPFPIENRPATHPQDISQVLTSLRQIGTDKSSLARWLSDWHLIVFLSTVGVLSEEDVKVIARIAAAPDLTSPTLLDELISRDGWQTLLAIAKESAGPSRPSNSAPQQPSQSGQNIPSGVFDAVAGSKICPHCTFENDGNAGDCEVCGLPLSG